MPSLSDLPGPAPMPVVGWWGNVVRFFGDPIGYMAPLAAEYGPLVRFARGREGPVLIREATYGPVLGFSPACAQTVWGQSGTYHITRVPGPRYDPSFQRITAGLFSMNDDRHRKHRRLIQPAFHKTRIEGYHGAMVSLTRRAVEGWRAGQVHDLSGEMTPLTLSVANKALFGLDPTPGVLSLGEGIQGVAELLITPAALVPVDLPYTPRRRLIERCAQMEKDLRAIIAHKRTEPPGDDVLATLLATRDEDGGFLTDDELIGQLFVLFFAGHDTTRSAIAWTLFLLSQHPQTQNDLQGELTSVLGGDALRLEDLPRLPLLDRVVKESLRLFTPAPFTARITVVPTTLEGVDLQVGTEVILSPYCLHRLPDLYPEPQRFRPSRWEKLDPTPFEYAPFGAGARMCIGAGFATMELKVVLSLLVQRFSFELAPGAVIDRKTTIVLSPKHGMPLRLRPPGAAVQTGMVRGNVREMVDLPS
ncbi:MAG: cytochrome P450 [Polyangiaceae bacterium]